MNHPAQLTDPAVVKSFLLAGSAIVTLVSQKTDSRFTFRVVQHKNTPHFVSVLTGPENTSSYTFLGTIFAQRDFRRGRKSPIGQGATSARAFAWAWSHLAEGRMPPACEVWHEGRCGRCGRALTVPSSIEAGIGPECMAKMEAAA